MIPPHRRNPRRESRTMSFVSDIGLSLVPTSLDFTSSLESLLEGFLRSREVLCIHTEDEENVTRRMGKVVKSSLPIVLLPTEVRPAVPHRSVEVPPPRVLDEPPVVPFILHRATHECADNFLKSR